MKTTFKMSLLALSTFVLMQPMAKAIEIDDTMELTDEMALEAGMTPVEVAPLQKMKMIINNFESTAGVERAVRSHQLVIVVNKKPSGTGAQTLTMYENGSEILHTNISTGKEERVQSKSGRVYVSTTPVGFFRPTKVYKDYLSYTWNAPMPNSVFFVGGIAIHATGEANYQYLGTRASGGCVRTKLADSKFIREKVMSSGRGQDFKIVNESKGRNRIANNSVSVDGIARYSGAPLNTKLDSWDTVIIVHE